MREDYEITDKEIDDAYEGTSLPTTDRRDRVATATLKVVGRYATGYTMREVLKELGILTSKANITKKGRRFLFDHYFQSEFS